MATNIGVLAGFGPERIRALRGELSRAAFARRVGVTPQTVYRWELADGAREARRPRGAELVRLERLARGESSDVSGNNAEPPVPGDGRSEVAPPRARESWVDDGLLRVLPALERVKSHDFRRGYDELVQILATGRELSANARAAAGVGIALTEIAQRADARAAMVAISPALADAEARRLSPETAAKVYAIAALVHASPDAVLFDVGRVHAYGARVAPLSPADSGAVCIAALAELFAAMQVGDHELLERAFTRLAETRWHDLPPLLALHAEEFTTVRPMFAGKSASSSQTYESIAERAAEHGYVLVESRTLSRLALCRLESLQDPEAALALVRRAKKLANGARICPGMHGLLALKAEIEALLRLGRTEEALLARAELERWSAETGMPAHSSVTAETRLLHVVGQREALDALATELRENEVAALKPICAAYADYVTAIALLVSSDDPRATVKAFERAEQSAGRWPHLLREVLLQRVTAHAVAGDADAGRAALRRAHRFVDGLPSTWVTAVLRRLEGGMLAAAGQWGDARPLLESAIATFELANDACDTALTRYVFAVLSDACEFAAPQTVADALQVLRELGIQPPRGLGVGVERYKQKQRELPSSPVTGGPSELPRVLVAVQRLSVRGAAPALILRELVAVLSGLFAPRAVCLEEIDSAGAVRPVLGPSFAASAASESSEFSDGAGRLLRVGILGSLEPDERAVLSILTTAAALALEAATLRGFGERPEPSAVDERTPELPGFVAASPAMRKLRSELLRLAASRATVIVSGESGSGKEVVARALHDLSERAGESYVAFNCATVPRDLFEGQLFGYRRGAFTGAHSDQPGVIRAASGGTLFLDEIGELPLDIQPKLLRFLENGEVFPLGERKPVRVDVRVLAATHRDLAALVREGRFRDDLYYRLQVVPIHVPPLRERREDVPVLARHFVRLLTSKPEPPVLAPDAISALVAHTWPGNVRELRNAIERALAFSPNVEVLRASDLHLEATRAAE